MGSGLTNDELVNNLTEEEWENFYTVTIKQAQHTSLRASRRTPSPPGITTSPQPKLKVSLKDFLTTSGKAVDWPCYRRRFIAAATANGHEEVLSSNM